MKAIKAHESGRKAEDICREFGVPTLMNIPGVTGVLAAGQVVTVDALMGRIFDGEVPELLALRLARPQVRADSPALPENQSHGGQSAPAPDIDTTRSIQIKPSGS